jgi:hypothetical protein
MVNDDRIGKEERVNVILGRPQGTEKNHENLSQGSRSPGRNLDQDFRNTDQDHQRRDPDVSCDDVAIYRVEEV